MLANNEATNGERTDRSPYLRVPTSRVAVALGYFAAMSSSTQTGT
jgi:hypothetical protein